MYHASIFVIYLSHYEHNATKVSEITTFFATKDPEKMWLSSFTSRIDLAMHHNLSWQYAIVFTRGIQARRFECGQPQSYLQHVSIRIMFLVMMLFIIKYNEYFIYFIVGALSVDKLYEMKINIYILLWNSWFISISIFRSL